MTDRTNPIAVSDTLIKAEKSCLNEFGRALFYAGIQEPVQSVSQLLDHVPGVHLEDKVCFMDAPIPADFGSRTWHAQTIGSAVGKLAPFLLTAAGVKALSSKPAAGAALLSQRSSLGLSLKEAALTGFLADAVFRPTIGKEDWIYQRLHNGSTGAIMFTAMTAGSLGLSELAKGSAMKRAGLSGLLMNPAFAGAISGIPGGLLSAEMEALHSKGRLANAQELGQSAYSTALVGGSLGAINQYGARMGEKLALSGTRGAKPTPEIVSDGPPVIKPAGERVTDAPPELKLAVERASDVPPELKLAVERARNVPPELKPAAETASGARPGTKLAGAEGHLELRPEQVKVVNAAVESISAQLRVGGESPGHFFSGGFNAREFLKARNYLVRHGLLEDGAPLSAVDHPAAALTSIFGTNWKPWLDLMATRGVDPLEAASCLPLRSSVHHAGLAEFLFEHAKPARTEGRFYDHNDLVSLLGDVAHKWTEVKPADTSLPLDDIAFRLTERMSRREFLPLKDKLIGTRLSGDQTSGEIIAFTPNNPKVGSLCFRCEGAEARVGLLSVEPMYRRLGLGQLLMRSVERHVPPGSRFLTLDVAAENIPARNLYAGLGFVRAADLPADASVLRLINSIHPKTRQ